MVQLLRFPALPRFIPSMAETALVQGVEIMDAYGEARGRDAAQLCAELLALPEIGSRLGLGERVPASIAGAGDVLDLVAAILEQHYVEGLSAVEVCEQLRGLMSSPEVAEIYETVMARQAGGIRAVDRWN